MKRSLLAVSAAVALLIVTGGAYTWLSLGELQRSSSTQSTGPSRVQVVAAENFWGSLVSQLGGAHVSVVSLVSDPNADPHEFESNTADARAVADASLVVVDGAGYDSWALSLIAANGSPSQTVINVQKLLGQEVGTNPHYWYDPRYVNETVKAMYRALVAIDPPNAGYYRAQYAGLNVSLWRGYMSRLVEIRRDFAGAQVAATEDMFVYLSNATGLRIVSPPGFMQAVAEGNDPPAQDLAAFQRQLEQNGTVTLLLFNKQTTTPLTESVRATASQRGIPTVGMTETVQPPDATFQAWMGAEMMALQNGLGQVAGG